MNLLFINTFIALAYMGVQGKFNLSGFLVGFALGYLALWVTQPLYGNTRYFRRVPKSLLLGANLMLAAAFIVSVAVLTVIGGMVTSTLLTRAAASPVLLAAGGELELVVEVSGRAGATTDGLRLGIDEADLAWRNALGSAWGGLPG